MKINNAFNETKIGPLPAEWQVMQLGNIIQDAKCTIDPRRYPTEEFDYYSIPAYQSSRLPTVEKGEEIRSIKNVVCTETVLFGKLNPRVPKIWLVELPSPRRKIASTEFIPLIPAITGVDSMFLYYLSWSPFVLDKAQELITGSTPSRQRVDVRSFLRLVIPLPPLYEQHGIAQVLHIIQCNKKEIEQIITSMQKLKKSLMHHLFTYGPISINSKVHITLKETEIGVMPKYWDVKRLGDIASIKGGKRLPKGHVLYDYSTEHPYIRVVDLKNGSVNQTNIKFLSNDDYKLLKNYTISSNDVYISIAGTIGLVGIVPTELNGANITENAAKIVLNNKIELSKNFLVYFLSYDKGQEQILLRTTKTSQPKLALARIKQIPIPFPPISEQKIIADILSAIDNKLSIEEKRKELFENLFNTMLNKLMTGQIRVNNLEMIK